MEHEAAVKGVGVSVGEEGLGAPAVVLEAGDEYVPIFISPDQAQSMQFALKNEPPERPLTHDLLVEMITEFGGAIDRIRIDGLSENTFLAKIDAERYANGVREEVVFDARPSDAIAIALRVECPIEVGDEVLDRAGRPPDAFEVE